MRKKGTRKRNKVQSDERKKLDHVVAVLQDGPLNGTELRIVNPPPLELVLAFPEWSLYRFKKPFGWKAIYEYDGTPEKNPQHNMFIGPEMYAETFYK